MTAAGARMGYRIVGARRSLAVDGNQIVPLAARCCKVDFSAPPLKAEREVIMRRHQKRPLCHAAVPEVAVVAIPAARTGLGCYDTPAACVQPYV
jgi:hypothetical protein